VHSSTNLSFPAVVSALLALGVFRYHVDYVASTATAYVSNAHTGTVDFDVAPIPSAAKLPRAGASWSKKDLVETIRWAQSGAEDYEYAKFARRAVEAGVTDYVAYLEGKRVIYLGGNGDMHVEWFPGAGPAEAEWSRLEWRGKRPAWMASTMVVRPSLLSTQH
jgi:uncharacterized protein YbcV (DUF1398 family)